MKKYDIKFKEFCDEHNKALDWYIKSWKHKYESPEWKICRLKMEIFENKARKHLKEAIKYL